MKKIGIVLFIMLSIFPIYKIYAENDETSAPVSITIQNAEKLIEKTIPDFIKKPVIFAVNTIEEFRKNIGTLLESEKERAKTEIEILKNGETPSNSGTEEKKSNKMLTYAKLYLFIFSSAILNNVISFYIISIVFLFLFIRRIWRLIF